MTSKDKTQEPTQAPDLDDVLAAMVASKKFTQAQIDAFTQLHMAVRYEPESIEIPESQEYYESDREVLLGRKTIKVRFVNGHDMFRLAPKVEALYATVAGQNVDKDGAPGDMNPMELTAKIFDKVLADRRTGQFTKFTKMVYEELAMLATNTDGEITLQYLLDVPLGHVKNLMVTILEVNQQDFLEWFGTKHETIGSVANTLIGKVTSTISWAKEVLGVA